ncbi:MAG: glucosaminidase domain-containing protein [Bacteroidetes bacterium]|nr:glucosaminidase domain-containing protein [Bacteroidota bacterium]
MLNSKVKYVIILIKSKKLLLTLLLVQFSIGSYTYSEIATHPISPKKLTSSNLEVLKPIKIDFSDYYLTPVSYMFNNPVKERSIITPSESIMDEGKIESLDLAIFLTNNNRNIDFNYAKNLADLYVIEATQEGVNPDLAFTQMCHETGFLRFDGTVDKTQNNFCGLGATGNGVKGISFVNQKSGVRAHIQHLKAYGSTQELRNELVDERFRFVKRGSVVSLTDLTGKWATDNKYDKKIRNLLNRLYSLSRNSEVTDI